MRALLCSVVEAAIEYLDLLDGEFGDLEDDDAEVYLEDDV